MSGPTAAPSRTPGAQPQRRSGRAIVGSVAIPLLWITLLFGCAGRLDWVRGWLSVVLYAGGMTTLGAVVRRYNASLMEERAKFLRADTKRFDKIILSVFFPLATLQPALAGLDVVRFRWSSMPFGYVYPGTALVLASLVLIGWTMVVNPHAETTVRIQTDRNHTVAASGPYRLVRHPMYLGCIVMYLGTPLVWGSVWALALGGVIGMLLICRTALEDRTLRRELAGYEDYATVTPARLVPYLW